MSRPVGYRKPKPTKEELYRKWVRREPMLQLEIAELLGVSRCTIYNIEQAALAKIRRALAASDSDLADCVVGEPELAGNGPRDGRTCQLVADCRTAADGRRQL